MGSVVSSFFTVESFFTAVGGSAQGRHREVGIRCFTEALCVFRNGVFPEVQLSVCLDEVIGEGNPQIFASSLSRARSRGSY